MLAKCQKGKYKQCLRNNTPASSCQLVNSLQWWPWTAEYSSMLKHVTKIASLIRILGNTVKEKQNASDMTILSA